MPWLAYLRFDRPPATRVSLVRRANLVELTRCLNAARAAGWPLAEYATFYSRERIVPRAVPDSRGRLVLDAADFVAACAAGGVPPGSAPESDGE